MGHVLHDFPIRLCIPREVTVGIRLVMRGIMLVLGFSCHGRAVHQRALYPCGCEMARDEEGAQKTWIYQPHGQQGHASR